MRPPVFIVLSVLALGVLAGAVHGSDAPRHLGVAHRGASAYAPEHTRAAYELALEQRADYVEIDLGVTADGVLICLHDLGLERTTNVEDVFPDRFETNSRGGRTWPASSFTLAEIKRLDAGSWFDPKFAGERILTWEEAVELVKGRAGLFPELKAPSVYKSKGFDSVALLAASLRRHGLAEGGNPKTPVIIQSFDEGAVRQLAQELPRLPRVFLLGQRDADRLTADGLEQIASFATGIGPEKTLLDGKPEVVRQAHAAGLTVIPYTFRSASTGRFATVDEEIRYYVESLGVDAVFTDNPDRARHD